MSIKMSPSIRLSAATGWYTVFVLTLAYMLAMVDRIILSLLVDPIERDLNINDTQFGFLQGFAFAIFYALAGIPIARFADRSPRRLVIAWGIFVWSLVTSLCGTARNFWTFLIYRLGVGVGESSLSPAGMSLLADVFPKNQLARAIAIYSAGGTVGTALAYAVGGFLQSVFPDKTSTSLPLIGDVHGWQIIFLVLGVPGIFIALLALTLPEPRKTPVHVTHSSLSELFGFMRKHARLLISHFGGYSFLYVITFGFISWIPAFMMRTLHYAPHDAGYLLGIISITAGVGGGISGGFLTDWLVRRNIGSAQIKVGMLSGVFLLPLAVIGPILGHPLWSMVLITAVIFLGHLWGAAATSGLQLVTPVKVRAQVTAIYIMCLNLVGYGIGPLAIGFVTDHVFGRPDAVGLSMAVVAGISLPLVILLLALAVKPFAVALHEQEQEQA